MNEVKFYFLNHILLCTCQTKRITLAHIFWNYIKNFLSCILTPNLKVNISILDIINFFCSFPLKINEDIVGGHDHESTFLAASKGCGKGHWYFYLETKRNSGLLENQLATKRTLKSSQESISNFEYSVLQLPNFINKEIDKIGYQISFKMLKIRIYISE